MRDGVPMNRDRIVELVMGICILAVLHALFILNHYALPGKARMSEAFLAKSVDEMLFLETLAMEGNLENSNNGEFVSLVNMRNGTVAGLKFFTTGDSLYVVNRECKQATVQEIVFALKMLPEKSASKFKGLDAVALPDEYGFKVCKKGGDSAR